MDTQIKKILSLVCFFIAVMSQAECNLWDYRLMTHGDITWNERNEFYLGKTVAENTAKKNPSLILHQSKQTIPPMKKCKWCYSYLSHQALNPEEAKIFIQKLHNDLLSEIHRNPEAIAYLAEDIHASTFSPSLIGLKVSFFKMDKSRMTPPHVARIHKSEGQTVYNFSDPETNNLLEMSYNN